MCVLVYQACVSSHFASYLCMRILTVPPIPSSWPGDILNYNMGKSEILDDKIDFVFKEYIDGTPKDSLFDWHEYTTRKGSRAVHGKSLIWLKLLILSWIKTIGNIEQRGAKNKKQK